MPTQAKGSSEPVVTRRMGTVEAWLGVAVIAAATVDMLLTVLYARIGDRGLSRFGAGVGSVVVARSTWWLLRRAAPVFGRRGRGLLTLAGPLSVLLVLVLWVVALVVGAALLIHPHLGESIVASHGDTPTDFVTALLAGASSLSLRSSGDLVPRGGGMQLLYLVDSLIGALIVALVVSYVMPVYNGLRVRNMLALTFDLLSRESGDAEEVVASLGPGGDFSGGQTVLSDLASGMVAVKEAHHFYPLLFFFHTGKAQHSLVRCLRLALDTVSHLEACLDDEPYGSIKASGSVFQLKRATMLLVETLSTTFLPPHVEPEVAAPGPRPHWREQYRRACRRLAEAGIATRRDGEAGAREYDRSRAEWDAAVLRVSRYLEHQEDDPDRRSGERAGSAVDRSADPMR